MRMLKRIRNSRWVYMRRWRNLYEDAYVRGNTGSEEIGYSVAKTLSYGTWLIYPSRVLNPLYTHHSRWVYMRWCRGDEGICMQMLKGIRKYRWRYKRRWRNLWYMRRWRILWYMRRWRNLCEDVSGNEGSEEMRISVWGYTGWLWSVGSIKL